MPSLQQKVDSALDWIAWLIKLAHGIALVIILLSTLLLSFICWHVYPPLILAVLVLAALAVCYVTGKKDELAELVEDADEESGAARGSFRAMPRRIVAKVVETALASAEETALLAPIGCVIIAVLAFGFGYNTAGGIALTIGITLFMLICCCCGVTKMAAKGWIESVFEKEEEEKTPLLSR